MHLRQDFLHLTLGDDYLGCLLLPISSLPLTLQHVVSQCEGFPLGPIALVDWALVTYIPPLWTLSSLQLSYQWPEVVVCQLLPPQGLLVPAISRGSSYYPYHLAVCPLFHLLAVGALLGAGVSGKGVCVGVLDALTVFRC